MVKDFENWWIEQATIMFGSTVDVMYAFCEETGYSFNDLYEKYYNEDVEDAK